MKPKQHTRIEVRTGEPNAAGNRVVSAVFVGFTLLWGTIAWLDWCFLTGAAARKMKGGVLFAPHLIILLLVSGICALLAPIFQYPALKWRVLIALVPASYVAFRLLV